MCVTCDERVGAGGRERRALLVLHAVAVVANDNVIEGPASIKSRGI